ALRLLAERLEGFAGPEGQHDSGEGAVQLRHVDPTAAGRRIIDAGKPALETLQHHKVIEVPVDDAWHRKAAQHRGLDAVALCLDAILTRGLDDVACLASVPGNATADPKLLQGNPGAVKAEHHGERRGTALDRLHLQDNGRSLDLYARHLFRRAALFGAGL